MKIIVLNGSPKGIKSVTIQYVHYIQNNFPEHELKIINISQRIKKIENDARILKSILDDIKSSDAVLWAFPVYVMLVPANYKRFIELISKDGVKEVFHNKYTAFLATSIHFFDHTAINYINAVCDDLNMKPVGAFSAEMYDLEKANERENLLLFGKNIFDAFARNTPTSRSYMPLIQQDFNYVADDLKSKIDVKGKKLLIITDSESNQSNLFKMVERFKASFSTEIYTINLRDLDIKGSCLGCIRCGYNNKCIYEDKDEYINFYNTKVKTADILVFASTIRDRFLSAKWKVFFDRSFFNNHAPTLTGKQIGYIISGPLRQIPNLRQILDAYVEMQGANCVGFITDEDQESTNISNMLDEFAKSLIKYSNNNYIKPETFLAVGGKKIFRDEVWGRIRFPFRADYLFYKNNKLYDFPQKEYKIRIRNEILSFLLKFPAIRKEVNKKMKEGMLKPLQKVLEK